MKIEKAIKQLDPTKINIIEMPGVDSANMIQFMKKLNKESPDAAKRTIILDGELNITMMSKTDLTQLRDAINGILEINVKILDKKDLAQLRDAITNIPEGV